MKYRSLRRAANDGDLAEVQRLCDEGADIHAQDSKGYFPLGGAVANGHVEVAEYLLERGANINQCSLLKWSPVFTAVQRKNAAMLALLLKYKPKLDTRTEVVRGQWENPLYDGPSPAGYTALRQAAEDGRDDLAALLLVAGADPDATDTFGQTPLHGACKSRSVAVVRLLLAHGADKGIADNWGRKAADDPECPDEIKSLFIKAGLS